MQGGADWHAANDHSKCRGAVQRQAWVRPRGATWYRPQRTPEADQAVSSEGAARRALVAASRVTGAWVYAPGGRRLGRLVEIALDDASGEVAFVVMASGGVLGFGERQARVPWSALSYRKHPPGYLLDLPYSDIDALVARRGKIAFERIPDRGGWAAPA